VDLRAELLSEGVLTLDGVRWSDGYAWCELQEVEVRGKPVINIRYLWASQCGRGHGTTLLKKIIRVADRMQARLYLEVTPFWKKKTGKGWCFESIREGGLDKAQLEAWYASHGFCKVGDKVMIRDAAKVAHPAG
jgi:hypothetical protein